MTINITLFVQMMNFFVVHLLMKRLLINPFLHTQYHDEQDQRQLDQDYAHACNQLVHITATKEQAWRNALKDLATQLPLKPIVPLICAPTIQAYSLKLDAEDVTQAARRSARVLLSKGI